MDQKEKIVQLLEQARENERNLVANLSDEERNQIGNPDRWSIRDVLAHIAEWRMVLAKELTATGRSPSPYDDQPIDHVNLEFYEKHARDSWQNIEDALEQSHQELLRRLQGMNDAVLQSPGYRGRPLWRFILGTGTTHPIIHLVDYYLQTGQTSRAAELSEWLARSLDELDTAAEWHGTNLYNLACFYSKAGHKQKAITGLRESLKLNPELREWSKEDPDFDPIREEPDFRSIYLEIEQ